MAIGIGKPSTGAYVGFLFACYSTPCNQLPELDLDRSQTRLDVAQLRNHPIQLGIKPAEIAVYEFAKVGGIVTVIHDGILTCRCGRAGGSRKQPPARSFRTSLRP